MRAYVTIVDDDGAILYDKFKIEPAEIEIDPIVNRKIIKFRFNVAKALSTRTDWRVKNELYNIPRDR